MTDWRRSLRVQLAVLGFATSYLPVLLLLSVLFLTRDESVVARDGAESVISTADRPPWVLWTALILAPAAAGLAWWWAGRAVRPIERVRAVAEEIEAADLGRRIGLHHGPTELVSLAAGFDAMLDRLEHAADAQRRLVEETSHELRTPLSVLAMNADVLLAHPEPTIEIYRAGLARSRIAAHRMSVSIEQLLADARGRTRTLDRQRADLVVIARNVVDEFRIPAAAKGSRLTLTAPSTAAASVDELTIHRAVANLVDNAVKYAPAESLIEVAVEVGAADATVIVTDHGPGIPPEDQARIFDRSWRGAHDADGSGLGLPIARQVALAHGGTLTVRSPGPSGDGAEFRLRLRR
ncbi:HAMP domain-containing sensor histidine kinase [Nocardia suismassiliense]|uniref:HAMP domain-containing sensor histidine kinase n=1 Tax=Nocardia suismassiliense TaxID=2077092 RepID=UPI00131F308D|nr:HAMP domain-containing sensor histidine kinase [Nocardia suismassiliense]